MESPSTRQPVQPEMHIRKPSGEHRVLGVALLHLAVPRGFLWHAGQNHITQDRGSVSETSRV